MDTGTTLTRVDRIMLFRRLPIDGQALKALTEAGLCWLQTNQEIVNALNVFPIPDGDTGTNMVLTMQAAVDEVANSKEQNCGKMAHAIAHGSLMGARGNSGVILSQLWRGFARSLDQKPVLDGASLVAAFEEARDTAYRGVVKPVEGTILTVAKDNAHAAVDALKETDDPVLIFERVVQAADQSVKRTPELLPVLKEAGVVDAGGMGLYYFLEGALRYIYGQPLDEPVTMVRPLSALKFEETIESIESGQDIEVVMDFTPATLLDLEKFYEDLGKMGTSIQVGEGEGIFRVHIHVPADKWHEPVNYARSLGTFRKASIENLLAQMDEIEQHLDQSSLTLSPVQPGQIAVVAVAPGPGIARVFASLGVAAIVDGGQSMNPSTQEILAAFEDFPTEKVIILPNNKNIILAAKATVELSNKHIAIIPTRSVPQGLAAMMRFVPDGDFDDVVMEMEEAMEEVGTGEITTAVRNAELDGTVVIEGQVIAFYDGNLICSVNTLEEACHRLLQAGDAVEKEAVTLFFGEEIPEGQAYQIADGIRDKYPHLDVEVQEGGQPYYPLILSIE